MPDLDLSITICSWNTVDDLRDCLQSLRDAVGEASFEVIVVDNASNDGSADMAATEFPEFGLIRSQTNLGFTGGHNLALGNCKGRILALLNSDTIVHRNTLATVVKFMDQDPSVGVVGPRLLNPDGSLQLSCRKFPNPMAAAFRNTILGRMFPNNRYLRDYLMTEFDHSAHQSVDWVSGAALFFRAELTSKIGLLDDKFFMYCEDVDFCKRTWDAGWKVSYLPEAVITHAIGRSSDKAPNRMIARFHRSMLRYYTKHVISERTPVTRPFYWTFAALALGARATIFYFHNKYDLMRRRFR